MARAAGGIYVTPTPSKPKVESAYPKPGARSVLTRYLLGGGRVLLGQSPEEVGVLQAIPAVRLRESGLPPRDGDPLDTDGVGNLGLRETCGEAQLLPNAGRGERVSIHQGINSPQRIRHHNPHPRKRFLKRYTTSVILDTENERVAVRDTAHCPPPPRRPSRS